MSGGIYSYGTQCYGGPSGFYTKMEVGVYLLSPSTKLYAHHMFLPGRLDDLCGDDVEPQLGPDPRIPERDVEQLGRLLA